MRFTLTIAATLALASPAFSAVVHAQRRSAPGLDISLSQISNSELKAVVTNTGDEEVSLLHYNFFNDKAPVKKVSVFRDDAEVQFTGILRRYASANLSSEVFTILAPGASFEDTVDIASTADLSIGGKFTVSSTGAVPYAVAGSSEISGYIPFKSNDLVVEVDGAVASKVAQAVVPLDRRSTIASCSGTRATALRTALSNTVSLANAAANAAASGSSTKFTEYFKSTSYRSTVAARLRAVASEASSTTSGSTTYYCTDPYGYCDTNVLAWTLPSQNVIANCDIYYTYLSALTSTCHAQDQATTTLHELTHAPGAYSPGTDDNGYGYAAATALSAAQAVLNADSYALYANAIYVGC